MFTLPAAKTPVQLFALHLFSLKIPLFTLAFLLTGPHDGPWALLWLLGIVFEVFVDTRSSPDRHAPPEDVPAWPFDALLVVQAGIQLINYVLFSWLVSQAGLFSWDALTGSILVGLTSGYSSIVVAHELIHRRGTRWRNLGRLLMATVMYEHFYTEHVRGHHRRVGTLEDPATARFGETYPQFFRRTVPGQFRSAWRLETRRLGDEDMSVFDRRLLKSRVVRGVILEWGMLAALMAVFGPAVLVTQLAQSFVAINLLEAVNYFEHWGLTRMNKRVSTVDSWDAESGYTRFSLVGLSRHADHHAHAVRPYQELRAFDESPKLPLGYMAMVFAVFFRNRWVMDTLTAELKRKELGPFAADEAVAAK